MKTRSALEICLPLALFVAACALSVPTLLIAIAWMTIGVISLGHRALESFPTAERVNEVATPGCLHSVSKRQVLCGFGIPSFWVG